MSLSFKLYSPPDFRFLQVPFVHILWQVLFSCGVAYYPPWLQIEYVIWHLQFFRSKGFWEGSYYILLIIIVSIVMIKVFLTIDHFHLYLAGYIWL